MITLKFGGTSMGNAERIISSADIIIGRAKQERVSVVVSAVSGVSNKLQESIDECVKGNEPAPFVLLLGAGRSRPAFDAVLYSLRAQQLEDPFRAVGCYTAG